MLRREKPELRDLIADDARVIALEGFTALPLGRRVDRGTYFRLSDPIVHRHAAYFGVVLPVDELLTEVK
jgi:hypothetical protein